LRLTEDHQRLVRTLTEFSLFKPAHLDDREAQQLLEVLKRRPTNIDEQLGARDMGSEG